MSKDMHGHALQQRRAYVAVPPPGVREDAARHVWREQGGNVLLGHSQEVPAEIRGTPFYLDTLLTDMLFTASAWVLIC